MSNKPAPKYQNVVTMNEPTDPRPPKTDTSGLLNQCVMNTPVIVNEN